MSPAGGKKKKTMAITVEEKSKIVAKHEDGMPIMAIAHEMGLSQSTISTILKARNELMIL